MLAFSIIRLLSLGVFGSATGFLNKSLWLPHGPVNQSINERSPTLRSRPSQHWNHRIRKGADSRTISKLCLSNILDTTRICVSSRTGVGGLGLFPDWLFLSPRVHSNQTMSLSILSHGPDIGKPTAGLSRVSLMGELPFTCRSYGLAGIFPCCTSFRVLSSNFSFQKVQLDFIFGVRHKILHRGKGVVCSL